jgi:hypothetical protein
LKSFEEVEAAYRLLSQSASWNDIVSQARDGASEANAGRSVQSVAPPGTGVSGSRLFFIGGIICLVLIVVVFILLKGGRFFGSSDPAEVTILTEDAPEVQGL